MREKQFSDMESIDKGLRQAFLDANNGRPPDDFVESAEGGGVDGALLALEGADEEEQLIRGIDNVLRKISPQAFENGELRSKQ